MGTLISFPFVGLFYLWVVCLVGNVYVPYRDNGRSYAWGIASVLYLIIGILALIGWFLLLIAAFHG